MAWRSIFLFLGAAILLSSKVLPGLESEKVREYVTVPDCRVRFQSRQVLSADQSGILQSRLSEGQRVKRGDICAQLRDGIAKARHAIVAARATSTGRIERAKQAAAAAQVELDLVIRANSDVANTFPEAEVQRRRIALRLAELETIVEEEELAAIRLQELEERERLNAMQIRAEIDGVVVRALKSPGESIQQGEAIVEIVDPTQVQVEGYLPESALNLLEEGDVVSVVVPVEHADSSDGKEQVLSGKLEFIDVSIQPVSRSVRCLTQVDNTRRVLREGMSVEIRVRTTDARKPITSAR